MINTPLRIVVTSEGGWAEEKEWMSVGASEFMTLFSVHFYMSKTFHTKKFCSL